MSKRVEGLNGLIHRIVTGLAESESFTIGEQELLGLWPYFAEEKKLLFAAIHEFAKINGWEVELADPGISATFRKISSR